MYFTRIEFDVPERVVQDIEGPELPPCNQTNGCVGENHLASLDIWTHHCNSLLDVIERHYMETEGHLNIQIFFGTDRDYLFHANSVMALVAHTGPPVNGKDMLAVGLNDMLNWLRNIINEQGPTGELLIECGIGMRFHCRPSLDLDHILPSPPSAS